MNAQLPEPSLSYAGIGSRKTPPEIIVLFYQIGKQLGEQKLILRSGGANGADSAFEQGCDFVSGPKEIYLPWRGFNGSSSPLYTTDPKAFDLVAEVIPYWKNIRNPSVRALQARNAHQVLGKDLASPCAFVICWTEQGALKGGTATAIHLAHTHNIPVFNLGDTSIDKLVEGVNQICLANSSL